ncbi:MAG: EAL domain-containing protein [Thiolinea sp.]
MAFNKNNHYNIESILLLANNLNISVIAEGVETEESMRLMKEYGIKYLQGNYFSKPSKGFAHDLYPLKVIINQPVTRQIDVVSSCDWIGTVPKSVTALQRIIAICINHLLQPCRQSNM